MIILLGPDNTGKTTLASKLIAKGLQPFKADRYTDYTRYMELLIGGRIDKKVPASHSAGAFLDDNYHWVCDRFFWCDLPYAEVHRRGEPSFTLKELHNLHLVTTALNPVVILTNHQAPNYDGASQFAGEKTVPESIQEALLISYRDYLEILGVNYIEWDYRQPPMTVKKLIEKSLTAERQVSWWRKLARTGVAGVGSTVFPTKTMIIAQDIGPSNYHNVPFERGPSGKWFSELLDNAEVPLSDIYVTNFDKWPGQAKANISALETEIAHCKPQHYILFGARARDGAGKVLAKLGIDKSRIHPMIHPGAIVNHSESIKDMERRKMLFTKMWEDLWDGILSRKPIALTLTAEGPTDVKKIR